MLQRLLTVTLALVLVQGLAQAAWAQPNSPLYAAKKVYEAGHSIDADAFLRYACISEEDAVELRAYFAEQVANLEWQLGITWSQVRFDYSGMTYELLERVGDQARVGISGTYLVDYPGGHEENQDSDVLLMQRVDGRWLMCGDQDLATTPLGPNPNQNAGQGPIQPTSPMGTPENPLSVLPPPTGPMQPVSPQGQDQGQNGPIQAAKQAYESSHTLDAEGFFQAACVEEPIQAEVRAEFLRLRQEAEQAAGFSWSDVRVDFSQVQYWLLEQVGDQARVAVSGPYVITYPGGREEDEDPDTILLQRVDGRWLMCGDQDTADMPLSPYSSPNY